MTVSRPDWARQATISWPKYFIWWTSPTAISGDHATWNQPVGVIDSGGFAISGVLSDVLQLASTE